MAKCTGCNAPLPAGEVNCPFCGVRNDVDLEGVHFHTTNAPEEERICPVCSIPMTTVNVSETSEVFLIEKCPECFGLFFDPGELEHLLQNKVKNVFRADIDKLNSLSKNLNLNSVTYRKCPVCTKFMNRKNFGSKSGIIIDECKEHGIFLDAGELKSLLEWTKAGGFILSKEVELEKAKLEEKKEARRQRERSIQKMKDAGQEAQGGMWFGGHHSSYRQETDLLGALVRGIGKLFGK